jgi:hypothetical protein
MILYNYYERKEGSSNLCRGGDIHKEEDSRETSR